MRLTLLACVGPSFWRGTDSMDGICYNHAGPEPPESTYHLSDLSDSGLKLCDSPSLCQNLDQVCVSHTPSPTHTRIFR